MCAFRNVALVWWGKLVDWVERKQMSRLESSCDKWRERALKATKERVRLKDQIRDIRESRDNWKQKAATKELELQAALERVELVKQEYAHKLTEQLAALKAPVRETSSRNFF